MFDIGWTEILVIAIVLIVVVGPKDLPKMLRTFGRTTSKMRAMAGDFRKQFDEALKEAELDDVKDLAKSVRSMNPLNDIRKELNPLRKMGDDIKADLVKSTKPDTAAAKGSPIMKEGEGLVPDKAAPKPDVPSAEPVATDKPAAGDAKS
jgi:sec-independent protein translocase protein TatB